MSIKYKVIAVFIGAFLINALFLGLYYRFVLSKEVVSTIDSVQEKLDRKAVYVADRLRQNPEKMPNDIFAGDPKLAENSVILVDLEKEIPVYGKEVDDGKVVLYGTAITEFDGKKLLVKVYRHYNITEPRTLIIVRSLLIAEGIIAAILVIMLGFAVHYLFVRPLMNINDKMSGYGKYRKTALDRVSRQDELGQIEKEFYKLVENIEDEKKMQARIIASISHDVKTPLTSVLGYVERLRNGRITDMQKTGKYLQTIYGRAMDIKDIISEFDDYLSSDSAGSTLNLKKYSVTAFCSRLVDEYTEELLFKGIEFSVDDRCSNCTIEIDLSKLRRVFGNIIGNAVRYVKAPKGMICIHCEKLNGKIRFTVEDNGEGVPDDDLNRIFEAFYTRDSSRGSGSGLGLAICKSLVETHGGAIWAEHSQLGGLALMLELPEKSGNDELQ